MPAAEPMTIDERHKYLGLMTICYARATKKERSHLLDDMEHCTSLDHKTIIRLMTGDLTRHPR
jgi:hypothetical protein